MKIHTTNAENWIDDEISYKEYANGNLEIYDYCLSIVEHNYEDVIFYDVIDVESNEKLFVVHKLGDEFYIEDGDYSRTGSSVGDVVAKMMAFLY